MRETGAITEIERVAIPDVPSQSVDGSNEGKLVHVPGQAVTEQELELRQFGVREKAIQLRWDSSIYQWNESKREKDDRTIYEYEQEWVDQPIDSSRFREGGHSNEGSKKNFQDGSVQAEQVYLGAFHLTSRLVGQIDNEQKLPLDPAIAMDVRPQGQVHDGVFYTGEPNRPNIGDERVEVYIVGPRHDVTVMAQQKGETFSSYMTKVGKPKEILYLGSLSKSEVIAKQRSEAALRRWLFRAIGLILIWIGLLLILSPLKAVVGFIPFISRFLEGALALVTFLIALAIWALTIAIAWFVVRPVLSIALITVATFALIFVYRARSKGEPSSSDTPSRVPPPLPN